MRRVYLDNNATTPVHPEVLEAVLPFYQENFGNPSSIHQFGRGVRVAVDESREKVASLLGADPSDVVFTSGGTESDNFAIKGIALANQQRGKHIITSMIEHPAILDTCKYLEKLGFKVTYLRPDPYGIIDPEQVREAITKDTILVSIMQANNEIGTIEPIAEIAEITKGNKIYFHTDAVQSLGKIPTKVDELGIDLLSLSGHKIYAPKGIGALYIRKGTKMHPLLHGGHQEKKRRSGTENIPGIVALGKACQLAQGEIKQEAEYLTRLRDELHQGILERIPHVQLNGHPTKRLPGTLNLSFKFVEGESLLINLDLKGVAISTGSACSSGSLEPSHVLQAIGVPHEVIHGSLRFSLGRTNTKEDIDYVLEVLPPIVDKMRAMSPLWEEEMREEKVSHV